MKFSYSLQAHLVILLIINISLIVNLKLKTLFNRAKALKRIGLICKKMDFRKIKKTEQFSEMHLIFYEKYLSKINMEKFYMFLILRNIMQH